MGDISCPFYERQHAITWSDIASWTLRDGAELTHVPMYQSYMVLFTILQHLEAGPSD